jgi:aryl-alcohol dehydrogenase-like predicted oxidoreductase
LTPPRLGIGTAQFGTSYGITNSGSPPGRRQVGQILRVASRQNVDLLDTAPAYGPSEGLIGDALEDIPLQFEIVTKTPRWGPDATYREGDARKAVMRSLERLRQPRLAGLLVHDLTDLRRSTAATLFTELLALRDEGLVGRVGASVYSPEEAGWLLDRFDVGIIQAPFNVLDRRLLVTGTLDRIVRQGIELHIRSIFLQGLLLTPASDLPPGLAPFGPLLDAFREAAASAGLSPTAASLAYAASTSGPHRAIVGVASASQLEECVRLFRPVPGLDLSTIESDDLDLIDPRRWTAT